MLTEFKERFRREADQVLQDLEQKRDILMDVQGKKDVVVVLQNRPRPAR